MDDSLRKQLKPGATVAVTQQVPFRDRVYAQNVRGIVVAFEQRPTGSWYAHAKDDRLWLDRLTLRKEDGELTNLSLDEYSRVEIVASP